ncbi:g12966 [Coccomyxa viridis]|uniref:Protein yippee-like n=1 Tax=Coccomyxa viridis TaxID=1274662 RepID=A0ABP1GBM6_9CHLO
MAGGTNFRTEITYGTSISPEYVMGIFCSKCDAALGKQYLDSRTHPDLARTGVCLNVSAMDSYQLGTGEVRFCERRPATPGAATPDKATAPESSALHQRIADLENDLVKVQNMVLLHQERLEALEGAR